MNYNNNRASCLHQSEKLENADAGYQSPPKTTGSILILERIDLCYKLFFILRYNKRWTQKGSFMDVNALMQAVGTVGFPIVCAIGMGWYIKYSTDRNREDIAKLNEQHKNEMSEVTLALNNNTLAIQHLCDMLSKDGDKNENG